MDESARLPMTDDPETINLCLTCKRSECNDCISRGEKGVIRKRRKTNDANKAVAQYDMEGNLIKIYSSRAMAGMEIGISPKLISEVIAGRAKTAGGYVWKNA